jgi:hypothetical protein
MLVAVVDALLQHKDLSIELSNWDGQWYVQTTEHWYFHHVFTLPGQYSTLGFLPLFPLLMWLVAHVTQLSVIASGVTLSIICGAVATVLVIELAKEWWGEAAARRALLFWCFFPGTIVFSMVYTEGLTIALVAGCLLLLERKRWVWAGLLAGLATAVAPTALAIVPVCVVAALLEFRSRGWRWRDRQALRSLWAPILSPVGVAGFGIFLWFWCGTPLASFHAQHGAWSEKTTPFAMVDVFGSLMHQIFIHGVGDHGPGGVDLNGVLALLGTAFLVYGARRLWQVRDTVPLTAWVWTAGVAVLALTSAKTPPNPRILICAFPLVLVVGAQFTGREQKRLLALDVGCLLVMSWFTFVGIWLRP